MLSASRTAGFFLGKQGLLVTILLVSFAFLAAGIPNVKLASSDRSFFGDENAEIVAVRELEDTYTGTDSALIMIVPPKGQVFAPATLKALRDITNDLWQTPYVVRVDSPVNYSNSYASQDEIFVEPLIKDDEEITQAVADRFQTVTKAATELRNRLLDENHQAYGISLKLALPDDVRPARNEIAQFLDASKIRWRATNPSFDIRFTGSVIGALAFSKAARMDAVELVPIALVAVLLLFLIFLRSVLAVLTSTLIVIMATLATFGIAGWLNIELTAGTAISPLAAVALTSASCVHVVLSWIRSRGVMDREDSVRHALSENIGPVTVATLTTALGFLGLNFADAPPLQEMGNMVAFGLSYGMFAVFVLLPIGLDRSKLPKNPNALFSEAFTIRLSHWVANTQKRWLVIFPIATCCAVYGISKIESDDSLVRYFDDRFAFRQDANVIQAKLTGLESVQFSFRSPEHSSIFDPQFLRDVDRFVEWLRQQPTVVAVSSVTDIVKRMNRTFNADDPEFLKVADTQEANAQFMMFYELSLPVGLDLNSSIDVDRKQTRVRVVLRSDHSEQVRSLADHAEAWMLQNTPAIATKAVGGSVAFARVTERNNQNMLYGLIIVLFLVSVTMTLTMRSIGFGVVSLVPNLLPAVLAFGLWGLTFRDVNLGSTVVTTMTFGIVVDDTVHFLMFYLSKRRSGLSVRNALDQTFSVVGAAIMITSISLIVGFAIMASSGFAINVHIGALTAITICFALLADLLFLPSLLLLEERKFR